MRRIRAAARAAGRAAGRAALPWALGVVTAGLAFGRALATIADGRAGPGDWGQTHHWWEAARVAWLTHREAATWDPFHCGGFTLWGQPQAAHLAPTYWLTGLPFGAAAGGLLFAWLHGAVAVAGGYALARTHASRLASALAGVAWGASGFFAWRMAEGHATFLPLAYLPFALLWFRRALVRDRAAAPTALLLALMVFEGGVYPVAIAALALGAELLASRAPWRRRLRASLLTVGLFAAVAAARLWPIAITMARHPRPTATLDAQTPLELLRALASAAPPAPWIHPFAFAEHAAYLGPVVLVLALLGASRIGASRRARALALASFVAAALALGDHGPLSPWRLLHALPGWGQLHVPSRFVGWLTLALTQLAALGLDALLSRVRRGAPPATRAALALAVGVAIVTGADLVVRARAVVGPWDGAPLAAAPARFHLVTEANYLDAIGGYPARHLGTASCYDPLTFEVPDALWDGDVPQARLADPAAGAIVSTRRTARTLSIVARLERPTRVLVNQRFDPDWRSDHGFVESQAGLLTVSVAPADDRPMTLRLWHEPPERPWALALSGLGVAAAIALWLRDRRAGRRGGGRIAGLMSAEPAGKAGRP